MKSQQNRIELLARPGCSRDGNTGLVRQLSEPAVGTTKRQSLCNTTPELGDDSKKSLNPDQLEEFKMSFTK